MKKLNRLLITGPLDSKTPLIVIEEVAEAHGIAFERDALSSHQYLLWVISTIANTGIATVESPESNLSQVATFVNPRGRWTKLPLLHAFQFLYSYTESFEIPPDFEAGLQTNDNIYLLNACVMWRLCIYHKIDVPVNASYELMRNLLRMMLVPATILHRTILSKLRMGATRDQLINVLHKIGGLSGVEANLKPVIKYSDLDALFRSLGSPDARTKKTPPSNHAEAIILAAGMGYDLTKTQDPIHEFTRCTKRSYEPSEPEMILWRRKDPDAFILKYEVNFEIPLWAYSRSVLNDAALFEGFTTEDISTRDIVELLNESRLEGRFVHGIHHPTINTQTVLDYEDVSSLNNIDCVSFGCTGTPMSVITYDELARYFRMQKSLQNPFSRTVTYFNLRQVRKLVHLGVKYCRPLKDAVETVLEEISSSEGWFKYLGRIYFQVDRRTQAVISNALYQLRNIAFYMRGWKGTGAYPIMDHGSPQNELESIYQRSWDAIAQFEESCRNISSSINILLDQMPLIGRNGSLVTERDKGKTVAERIAIVKAGENGPIHSCIRMSANYFIYSSLRCMRELNLEPGYDISHYSESR
jgi:hypothetical protein